MRLLLILLLLSGPVAAGKEKLHILGTAASYHFLDKDHNEVNPGLGIQYKMPRHYNVGYLRFKNSHDEMSNMLFTETPFTPTLSFLIGVADGYEAVNSNGYLAVLGITWHHKYLWGLINTEAIVIGLKIGLGDKL